MAITKPCPRCQEPMEIPQPTPEKIQCAKCGAVVQFRKPAAAAAAAAPAPAVEKETSKSTAGRSAEDDAPVKAKGKDAGAEDAAKKPKPVAAGGGFLSYLHTIVPKPMLFGFYGGLGGLLGVLLFGEIFWVMLHPKPIEPVTIRLAVPNKPVEVYKGNVNKLTIKLQRLPGFEGEVRIDALDLPWDVSIPPVIVAADQEDAELQVSANVAGEEGIKKVKLRASFVDNPKHVKTIKPFQDELPRVKDEIKGTWDELAKNPSPEAREQLDKRKEQLDKRLEKLNELLSQRDIDVKVDNTPPTLQLSVPQTVSVYAGGQNRFGFKIARSLFSGPVRVEVLDLPMGISIPMVELSEPVQKKAPKKGKGAKGAKDGADDKDDAVDNEPVIVAGQMSVVAAKDVVANTGRDAQPVVHLLDMEVHSLRDHKIKATIKLQLNVLPPPGKLQLAVSPQVTVYPGTTNKFFVKISRQEFKAPVEIEIKGQPRGVLFSKVVIEEGKSEAEIEVTAGTDVKPDPLPFKGVEVTAKALIGEDITASFPLSLLVIEPPPTMQMAVSPKVSVYPGGSTKFGVKIARRRFTGPVRISGQAGLVTVPQEVIAGDKTDVEVMVSASPAALNQKLPMVIPLTVTAQSQDGRTTTSEPIQVEILAPESDLQLTVSPEVEVYQGGKCKFTVNIARSGFVGPVQLSFAGLPAGANFFAPPIVQNTALVNGAASIDVEPKRYEIDVTATGRPAPDGKTPTATKKMTLTVKPFDPALRPPLDVVFVLDVTTSMDDAIAGVKNGIGQFVKALKDKDLDARIGLVAFRDITEKDATNPFFQILKFNGEQFTTDTKAFSAEVGKLVAAGGGDFPESSVDALEKAAYYPFRPNALPVYLLITDNEPQTEGNSLKMSSLLKILAAKKAGQIHLIVPNKHLPKYQPLHTVAKGSVFDFDELKKKKNAKAFVSLLPALSKEILTTIGAPPPPESKEPMKLASAAPPTAPPGEKAPSPRAEASPSSPKPSVPAPPTIGVAPTIISAEPQAPQAETEGPPRAEAPALQGVQSTQMYADKDKGWLLTAVAVWTAMLAAGISLMLVGAQKRYLQQAWLRIGEVFRALAAGITAGLIAGAMGQWVYFSTPGSPGWSLLGRFAGWIILGGLIAGGMSFFVPNLKWRRAILGGCIGGLIGVIGFELASTYIPDLLGRLISESVGHRIGEFLGRCIGGALLGFCIGVMVALAEIAFRRFWLEVAFGREIRTVTLGPTSVALGGDDKVAGVFVPNAIPKALGYRVDRHRVICEDFATGKTADAPPGDERKLEGAKIKVCSADSAQATGVSLQIVVTRELALMEGMPLTAEDIPGLEAQGLDGIVAVVNRRPNNPKIFVLRNRSKQPWTVTESDGNKRRVDPGLGIELSTRSEVDFGQVKATLDPGAGTDKS